MNGPLALATDVTYTTLGASGLWLGTRAGAGGTAKLTESFLATAYSSLDNRLAVPYNENQTRALNTTLLNCCLPSTDAIDRPEKIHA